MDVRSTAFACGLVGLLGCPRGPTDPPDRASGPAEGASGRANGASGPGPAGADEQQADLVERAGARASETDLRVDPSRCSGDGLDLAALVRTGLCTIPTAEARALPEELVIEAPRGLEVAPGERLEFELILRNPGLTDALIVDLRFRHFLPLAPEGTVRLDEGLGPDESCTLRAISTDPPPERISLPPGAELAIPCEWHANTRLVDPGSYVGSECVDFPALAPGRYRSVFRINGGVGSQRDVPVEFEVRRPRP